MGDDGLLSTPREHHLGQKPLKYLKMCPVISPVHMSHEVDTRQPPARAGLVGGVSQSVSPGPDGMINYSYSYVGWHEAWRGWSHPLRSPGRRQGQLCDIISPALQRKPTRDLGTQIQKLDTWIPKGGHCIAPGKWTPGGLTISAFLI